MNIFKHFNLQNSVREPTLGRKRTKVFRNTLIIYLGIVLGVLGKYIFALYNFGQKFDLSLLDPFWYIISLIIAAVIFPYIYKQAKLDIEKIEPVQFFIAIQNGFFWQTIIEILGESLKR